MAPDAHRSPPLGGVGRQAVAEATRPARIRRSTRSSDSTRRRTRGRPWRRCPPRRSWPPPSTNRRRTRSTSSVGSTAWTVRTTRSHASTTSNPNLVDGREHAGRPELHGLAYDPLDQKILLVGGYRTCRSRAPSPNWVHPGRIRSTRVTPIPHAVGALPRLDPTPSTSPAGVRPNHPRHLAVPRRDEHVGARPLAADNAPAAAPTGVVRVGGGTCFSERGLRALYQYDPP